MRTFVTNAAVVTLVASAAACFFACSSTSTGSSSGVTFVDAATDTGASSEDGAVADDAGGTKSDASVDAASVSCTQQLLTLLKPIDSVSTGDVSVVSDAGGVKTYYFDASAGGTSNAAKNPRLYVKLSTGAKVDVTDVSAAKSSDWDLSLKRAVLFTNSGHGGPGQGGAGKVQKAFADVTLADAKAAKVDFEEFVDSDCEPYLDQIGSVETSFRGWYDYQTQGNQVTPTAGTWIVKGAKGEYYKVQIVSFYGSPDGGEGDTGGRFVLKVAAL